jgi:hypothetical protein
VPSPIKQLRLPEELLEYVEAQAQKEGMSFSRWIRGLILDHQLKEGAKPLLYSRDIGVVGSGHLPTESPPAIRRCMCGGLEKPNGRCTICNQNDRWIA